MSNLPALRLAAVVGAAARSLPATTGVTRSYQGRTGTGPGPRVLVLDTSDSMSERAGARRRIDHLRDALQMIARPPDVLLPFSCATSQIATPAELPEPSGGTAMDLALRVAATYTPSVVLVVSDGEPNVPSATLEAARDLTCRIDVLYCGAEDNDEAIRFMRDLAGVGRGRVVVHRWGDPSGPQIAHTMRMLLAGPGAR